jgi:hypothetical protein
MFYPYPDTGNFSVDSFSFFAKFLPSAFPEGLHCIYSIRPVALTACILMQCTRIREVIHRIRHLFIVHLTANSLVGKKYKAGRCDDNSIFNRVPFLFSIVFFFLLIVISRARDFPFRLVVKQHRKGTVMRKFGQTFGKFFVCLGRYQSHCFKTKPENMAQTVYEGVAMFPVHAEASCVILLQRIILQIHKDKKRRSSTPGNGLFYRCKNSCIGYDACLSSHTRTDNHHVLLQNKEATTRIENE